MKAILILIGIIAYNITYAQHDMHDMHNMPVQKDSAVQHDAFTSAHSLSLPMGRNGSGTGWQPDETPMYAYMVSVKKWNLMVHGTMFIRYNSQNVNNKGKRGSAAQIDAPNWGMLMAQGRVGRNGLLTFSGMFSVDRLTMDGNGYPLLFQSGETWKGEALVDRQHPHDLFAELAVAYTHRITKDVDITAYFGYPGEPALGPTAFMHRISAINNPDAPLSHHWQDATHITFGVATIGIRYKIAKLEASIFTGREPNENRFDFDKPRFDSYSYRLTVNPHKTLSVQFSQGFIHSPESIEPDVNIMRTTASVQYVQNINNFCFMSATFSYGLNTERHSNSHSFLYEDNLHIKMIDVYGRYEFIQKSTHELSLSQFNKQEFNIHALTMGAAYKFFSMANLDLSLGIQETTFFHPNNLSALYGKTPESFELYLKISPSAMKMSNMKSMPDKTMNHMAM